MEKFIQFNEAVTIKELTDHLKDERILILRASILTGTIQIKIANDLSERDLKKAFHPYTILKIYREFPYPIPSNRSLSTPGNCIKAKLAILLEFIKSI